MTTQQRIDDIARRGGWSSVTATALGLQTVRYTRGGRELVVRYRLTGRHPGLASSGTPGRDWYGTAEELESRIIDYLTRK